MKIGEALKNSDGEYAVEAARLFEMARTARHQEMIAGPRHFPNFGHGVNVMAPNKPSSVPPTERQVLQDLLARAARNAIGPYVTMPMPLAIGEHKKCVQRLLEEFLEAADYIQAQIPMVESAFKDRPELQARVVGCLQEAYHKLCSETFGKEG